MKYRFSDIAGYQQEKEELKVLCEIINHRIVYKQRGAKLPKGIIFYGESGTGKTLFSKVMADECGLNVIRIDAGNGKSEIAVCRNIRKAFASAAKRREPSMIFFDELDKLLPNVYEKYVTDRAKLILTQLLTEIDGMNGEGNFIFVATCNNYAGLPETLVRPGRIDRKMHIGLPSLGSRVEILRMYMKGVNCTFALPSEKIAELCAGFSCAALETLVNECVLHSGKDGFVGEPLVQGKIREIRDEDIPRKIPTQQKLIMAYLNLGAFVVARSFNDGGYTLSLDEDTVCNDYFNGLIHDCDDDYDDDYDYDDCEEDEDKEDEEEDGPSAYYTRNDYLHALCALFGGYAAQEILLNKVYDNVGRHLWTADCVLNEMSKDGLLGLELRFSSARDNEISYSAERLGKINAAFDEIAENCLRRAKEIVAANAEVIRKLVPVLAERGSIDSERCELILKDLGGIRAVGGGEIWAPAD